MLAWLLSIAAGAIAAVVSVLIAVASLTGIDAGEQPPHDPGHGQYADD